MDLKAVALASIDKLLASGQIETTIETIVQKTVLETVRNALGTYTDFGEALQAAVEKSLQLNGEINLESYNDTILKIIARQVEAHTNNAIQRQVESRMKELLTPAPESIKLTDLVQQFIDRVKKKQQAGCVCYGEQGKISLHIHRDSTPGFHYVELDEEAKQQPNRCGIRIGLHDSKVFSLSFRDQNLEKQLFVGPLYGFERMLFQMKAAGSKVILDAEENEIETTYELAHE